MTIIDKLDQVEELLKHQPGRHDQQSHAGTRGRGGTAGGISTRTPEEHFAKMQAVVDLGKAKTKDQIAVSLGKVIGEKVSGRSGIGNRVRGDRRNELASALEKTGWKSIGSAMSRGAVLGDPDEQVYQKSRRKVSLTLSGTEGAPETVFRVM